MNFRLAGVMRAVGVFRAILLGSVALLLIEGGNAATEAVPDDTADAAVAVTEAAGGTGMLTSGQSLSQVPERRSRAC